MENRQTLKDVTIELLRNRPKPITLAIVSKSTNLSISFLSSLLSENPPQNPGVNHIQTLYEYLNEKPLIY